MARRKTAPAYAEIRDVVPFYAFVSETEIKYNF